MDLDCGFGLWIWIVEIINGVFKRKNFSERKINLSITLVSRYCWVCACVFVFMENMLVIPIYLSKKFRSFVLVSLRSSNRREARNRYNQLPSKSPTGYNSQFCAIAGFAPTQSFSAENKMVLSNISF